MNSYELMVIFTPVLSSEEFKAATKNLKKFVTDNEGEIVGEDAWGLRHLLILSIRKQPAYTTCMEY
jgi:small subunit ribosomal protein S6